MRPTLGPVAVRTEDGRQLDIHVVVVAGNLAGWSATAEVNGKVEMLPGGSLITFPEGARGRIVSQVVKTDLIDVTHGLPHGDLVKRLFMPGMSTQSLIIRGPA